MTDLTIEVIKLEEWIKEHNSKMAGFLCSNQIQKASHEASLLSDARKYLADIRVLICSKQQQRKDT